MKKGRDGFMKKITAIFCFVLLLILSGCTEPKDVEVNVDAPLQVMIDKEFVITATVKNTASKEQKLVSLDIGDEYLKGIAIVKTEPDNSESRHIPLDNTVTYTFNIPVKPGKEIKVTFYAKALKKGDFNSEIDFCINNEVSFLSKSIRTVVQ
jgi:hypothetical protein